MRTTDRRTNIVFVWIVLNLVCGCGGISDLTGTEAVVAKQFKLSADEIKPIAKGYGACIATDMITVEGHRVQFMYRELSDGEADSGWRFTAGVESDEYMAESSNHGVYDVNTIANYDPNIIPLLDAPIGSAFERSETGKFVPVEVDPSDD